MNQKIKKILAAVLAGSVLFSLAGCSDISELFDLNHGSRSSRSRRDRDRDDDDDDDDEDDEDETEETEETEDPDETEESRETGESQETGVPTETEPAETLPNTNPGELNPDLVYLDHIPTETEIHPGHAPGTLSGAAAVEELNAIELETIGHYISNYVDAEILFEHPEDFGIDTTEVSWGDGNVSDDEDTFPQEMLDRLYAIDYESLEPEDRVFYDKIVYDMEDTVFSAQYTALPYYESTFNPLVGPQCDLLFILEVMTFDTVEDAENYITLVRDIDRYFDEICEFEEDRAAYGFACSDSNYEDMGASFDSLVAQTDDCFLYESFENRLDNISGLSQADRQRLISDHEDAMRNVFFPEMQECADRMRALIGSGGPEGGVRDYPYGREYFAYTFRNQSNCSRSVEDVTAELEDYTYDMMDEYMDTLSNNYLLYLDYMAHSYSQGDTDANLQWLSGQITNDFPALCEHSYSLMDVPEDLQENFSPAAYLGYHLDSYDSNLIITNNANVDSDFGITCAHEGYPGHMFQSIYTRMSTDHPYMYLFDSTAYAEGWATYVENYSFKYFESNEELIPIVSGDDRLNILLMARWDIGINYEGWTLEECTAYYEDLMGLDSGTIEPSLFEDTYALLTSDPCYAVKYGIGFLNTTEIMARLHENHPGATDQEVHTAYLEALTGTFEQIEAEADRLLSEN